ncbi:MAG: hypothetical protein IPI02_23305 [Sterolibacteriaceae bacterium]|nr:hypothetical protein [Sterolibacteriaceae bacterium]
MRPKRARHNSRRGQWCWRSATGHLAPAGFYAALGSRREVVLVNDAVSDVLSDAELRLDPLHPNPAGHVVLSEKLEKSFRASGLLR